MPDLGISELLVIGIVLMVFVGPERLPHATRTLGRLYGKMRRAADELRRALVLEADRLDEEERLRELRKRRVEEQQAREEAASAHGGHAQTDKVEEAAQQAADEAAGEDTDDTVDDDLPPGFTAEEWEELPDHIRDIVRKRRAAP